MTLCQVHNPEQKDGAAFEFMLDDGIILQGADIVAISVQTHADRRSKPPNTVSRLLRPRPLA